MRCKALCLTLAIAGTWAQSSLAQCCRCPKGGAAAASTNDRPFWDSRSGRYLFQDSATKTWYYWQPEVKQWFAVAPIVAEPIPPAPTAALAHSDQHQHSKESPSTPQPPVSGQVQTIYGGQRMCPVMDEELGAHGAPIPVTVRGQTIYVCCKGCIRDVQDDPDRYLAKVAEERARLGVNPAKKAAVR